MKRVWNVSAHARVLDWAERAVLAGESTVVADAVAVALVAGPDWSYEDPRQRRGKKSESPINKE